MTNPLFCITRISPDLFRQLFAMSGTVLHERGACRVFADDAHLMMDAQVCEGVAAAQMFARFFISATRATCRCITRDADAKQRELRGLNEALNKSHATPLTG